MSSGKLTKLEKRKNVLRQALLHYDLFLYSENMTLQRGRKFLESIKVNCKGISFRPLVLETCKWWKNSEIPKPAKKSMYNGRQWEKMQRFIRENMTAEDTTLSITVKALRAGIRTAPFDSEKAYIEA